MTGETMYGSRSKELTTLVLDTIVFLARSIFFICESLVLSMVPNRFRKLKVSSWCQISFTHFLQCVRVVNSIFEFLGHNWNYTWAFISQYSHVLLFFLCISIVSIVEFVRFHFNQVSLRVSEIFKLSDEQKRNNELRSLPRKIIEIFFSLKMARNKLLFIWGKKCTIFAEMCRHISSLNGVIESSFNLRIGIFSVYYAWNRFALGHSVNFCSIIKTTAIMTNYAICVNNCSAIQILCPLANRAAIIVFFSFFAHLRATLLMDISQCS